MSVVSIMAAILEDELREYSVLGLTQLDRETIVRNIIERTAELGIDSKRYQFGPSPSEQT
jgi:DNA helicase HerA-like ATPase